MHARRGLIRLYGSEVCEGSKGQANALEVLGEAKESLDAILKPVTRQLEGTWA